MGHTVGRKDFIPRLALSLFLIFKMMLVAVSDFLNNSLKQLCHFWDGVKGIWVFRAIYASGRLVSICFYHANRMFEYIKKKKSTCFQEPSSGYVFSQQCSRGIYTTVARLLILCVNRKSACQKMPSLFFCFPFSPGIYCASL